MTTTTPNPDAAAKSGSMHDEADIGSGERSPGQHETDQMIKEIPGLPADTPDDKDDKAAS